jgi:hypothetical protein
MDKLPDISKKIFLKEDINGHIYERMKSTTGMQIKT